MPGGYHVGFTMDLALVVDTINERYPSKNIYLCGFSLGGNVILKYLGELGEKAFFQKNIHGAAVTGVPFDPAGAQRKIDVGWSRILYSKVCLCYSLINSVVHFVTFVVVDITLFL
jgi:predicted alpha/beta-fold hydrolase